MISIIIPVLNEAAIVGAALDNLFRQSGNYEIIVVDGGSGDGTCEVVQRLPVRLVHKPKPMPPGIGSQINLGAEQARGHILIFLHVDVQLPPDGIARVEAALAEPQIIGGGFMPVFHGATSGSGRLMLGLVERAWRARTRIFHWFAGDVAPFIRTAVFRQGGGYPTASFAADWDFAAHLRRLGRLAIIREPVRVDCRRHVYNGVLKTLLVTGSLEVMYRMGVDRAFLRDWYRRWLPRERELQRELHGSNGRQIS